MSEPSAAPDGRGGPHVFVDDLDVPDLADHDRHHLARVLRLRPGDPLTVGDGAGRWRPARFGPVIDPTGDVVDVPAPEPPITVAFSPVKGDRPEWAVQKLTEIGVDRIVLLDARRTVVRWDEARRAKQLERLGTVAREAAMQSRRVRLPVVEGPVPPADLVGAGVALADRSGDPPALDHPVVLVGPEGGWDADELALDVPRVRLSDGVLRTETAAVVAGTALALLRRQLVIQHGE